MLIVGVECVRYNNKLIDWSILLTSWQIVQVVTILTNIIQFRINLTEICNSQVEKETLLMNRTPQLMNNFNQKELHNVSSKKNFLIPQIPSVVE